MKQVRSAGVLSLSNKHAIILQNPTNRKAERILLTPMRSKGWGAGVKQVCGRLMFFPYPISIRIYDQSQDGKNSAPSNEN